MNISDEHPWNVTYRKAIEIQERLRDSVVLRRVAQGIRYLAGLDVSYEKHTNRVWAGAVVFEFPRLAKVEEKCCENEVSFPYIPTLLSFREIPPLLDVLRKLEVEPDLILCDGQGVAHPRGLGLASHLGVVLDKPTIGCAKTKLVGEFNPVGQGKGEYAYLRYRDRVVGAVVRTRQGVKPLFVSPGHRVVLNDCIRFVLATCSAYRIPEPLRQAHNLVNSVRSASKQG